MISVVTVTNRYGGIDVAYNSLRKQTHKDIEWILVDELYDDRHQEVGEYVKDVKLKHIKPRPKAEGHVWNLPEAYNDGFRAAEGELIVILEDYIWLKADALEKFWNDHLLYPEALFTGVGNKAPAPQVTNPRGKLTIFNKPYSEIPTGITEYDTRITGHDSGLKETNHSFFEFNWCAFPRELVIKMGGMDERCGVAYCGQDRNFALRAFLMNRYIYIDFDNESIGLDHQQFEPRPSDWETKHYKLNPVATRNVLSDEWSVICDYLK